MIQKRNYLKAPQVNDKLMGTCSIDTSEEDWVVLLLIRAENIIS